MNRLAFSYHPLALLIFKMTRRFYLTSSYLYKFRSYKVVIKKKYCLLYYLTFNKYLAHGVSCSQEERNRRSCVGVNITWGGLLARYNARDVIKTLLSNLVFMTRYLLHSKSNKMEFKQINSNLREQKTPKRHKQDIRNCRRSSMYEGGKP